MSTQLEDIQLLVRHIESMRGPWEEVWRDIKKYIIPHRGFALDNEEVSTHSSHIVDATATRALRITASGLLSGLTSPARPWFRLYFANPEDGESVENRIWLDSVEEIVRNVLLQTGFYQTAHAMFTELIAYGSASVYIESHPLRDIQFYCLSCGEFAWAGDDSGAVDTVVRRYQAPIRCVAERFGVDSLSREHRELLQYNPYSLIELVHVVFPSTDHRAMPFQSITYIASTTTNDILHIGGYWEFPYIVARWDATSSSIYGYSPAMDTLPDVKMLQEMAKSQITAIHKVVNPPMKVPASFKTKLNLIPGGPNYVTATQNESITPLYQINPDVHALSTKIEDVRKAIKEGFFTDLFLMFQGKSSVMTAQEVIERSDEKLLVLGPVIERHQTEILTPLLKRTLAILDRAGILPPSPEGSNLHTCSIEYVSALAQAQKVHTGNTIRQMVKDIALLQTLEPTVAQRVDYAQVVEELAKCNAVPTRILNVEENTIPPQQEAMEGGDVSQETTSLLMRMMEYLQRILGRQSA
ncbi:MAG: head-tail connector protein [Desulfovibrionaceae bacterium]|nr:head-tail connector protein [Desulfovibrionaceae bacterium]